MTSANLIPCHGKCVMDSDIEDHGVLYLLSVSGSLELVLFF